MHLPRVWAEIDLLAIQENLEVCRSLLGGRGSRFDSTVPSSILGVVKADAYGHGAVPVASTLERSGIAMLGVGDSHEAIELRQAGITSPILILGAVVEGEIPDLIEYRITPMVHSPERIDVFDRIARRLEVVLGVHLLVDTGMSRLGVSVEHAVKHLEAIRQAPNLELLGLGTHLASAAEDPAYTRAQIDRFRGLISATRRVPPILHVAASAALSGYPECHFDMVRIGAFLYGLPIREREDLPATSTALRSALSLYTQIVHLRDVPPGASIGYGGTFRTTKPARIATLPVGYHDGFVHRLSNRAATLVRGRRAPVVGRVSMDYTMVDVTEVPGASVGDRVTLLGTDGPEQITAADLATWGDTIPYEIPSLLGNRVRRFYQYGAEPRSREDRRISWPFGRGARSDARAVDLYQE